MHSEYIQYAHHLGLPDQKPPEYVSIEELTKEIDGRVWMFDARGVSPAKEWFYPPESAQPIVTEDIDYEIVEPLKLPPSNTQDNETQGYPTA